MGFAAPVIGRRYSRFCKLRIMSLSTGSLTVSAAALGENH